MTRRKEKIKMAKAHSVKGIPGFTLVSGCPECPWQISHIRKQNEPKHVAMSGDEVFGKCTAGHTWRVDGYIGLVSR